MGFEGCCSVRSSMIVKCRCGYVAKCCFRCWARWVVAVFGCVPCTCVSILCRFWMVFCGIAGFDGLCELVEG